MAISYTEHKEEGTPQSKDCPRPPTVRGRKHPLRESGLRFQRRDVADPRSTLGLEVKCQIQWWGPAWVRIHGETHHQLIK